MNTHELDWQLPVPPRPVTAAEVDERLAAVRGGVMLNGVRYTEPPQGAMGITDRAAIDAAARVAVVVLGAVVLEGRQGA